MSDMTPKELTALKLRFYDALVCDPKLSAMDLRIAWLLLSRYLNGKSLVAWPSAETLARDLGSSVRGVRLSIKRLAAPGGWFKIKKGRGRRQSNRYSANFERVNASSPLAAETVNTSSLKGELAFPETVNASSPKSPLSKPIEKPFEGAAARDANQQDARQGDRGSRNDRAQGHMMLPIQGGYQKPTNQKREIDWTGWEAWIVRVDSKTPKAARDWLMAELDRIADEHDISVTEAMPILDRALKKRRKMAA